MSYNLIISGIITEKGEKTFTFRKNNQKIKWKEIFSFISLNSIIPIEYYNINNGKKYIEYNKISDEEFLDTNNYSYRDMEGNVTCNGLLLIKINRPLFLKENVPHS